MTNYLPHKIKFLLFLLILSCFSFPAQAETTPENTTFALPTFKPETPLDFRDASPALRLAPSINTTVVFNAVMNCYPSPSRFDISVKLQAGGTLFDESNSIDTLTSRGNYYVGIVAEMPLLDGSATLERERQREYDRRKETSAQVARFISALSKRNQAERELGLYTALEKRARARVQMGVTAVSEQVGYLEKVIASQQKITSAIAEANESRLILEGTCEDSKRPPLSQYLQQVQATGGD